MLIIELVCQPFKCCPMVVDCQDHFSAEHDVEGGLAGNNWNHICSSTSSSEIQKPFSSYLLFHIYCMLVSHNSSATWSSEIQKPFSSYLLFHIYCMIVSHNSSATWSSEIQKPFSSYLLFHIYCILVSHNSSATWSSEIQKPYLSYLLFHIYCWCLICKRLTTGGRGDAWPYSNEKNSFQPSDLFLKASCSKTFFPPFIIL